MNVDIDSIKKGMLAKYPFFGSVVASINLEELKGLRSLENDGSTIYFDPDVLDEMSKDKQIFLFTHEICHIAFNHAYRSIGKNIELWRYATDAVVNAFLEDDGYVIPASSITEKTLRHNGLEIHDLINFSSEEIYDELVKLKQKDQEGRQSTDDSKDEPPGEEEDELVDTNENEVTETLEDIDDKDEIKDDPESEKTTSEGTNNSGIRETDNVVNNKPLVEWRLWLREALNMNVDWTYKNAVVEDGIVRPHLESYPEPETEILLDTSGSIDESLLKNFLRECKYVLQESKVKVGCFDDEFYGWTEIETVDDIDNLDYIGGGGTNFNAAVGAFTKRAENKIVFTDGLALNPDTVIDALWILIGETDIDPPGGRVIHFTEEQARKLYGERSSL